MNLPIQKMSTSVSTTTTTRISNTDPIIKCLTVLPYQRIDDTITWYPVKIELNTNQAFEIKYRYSEFVQFSRKLHRQYSSITKNNLPILKKENKYYNFMKKGNQKYIDRQIELERFCEKLLQTLPAVVTCSEMFLSFFVEKQHQQTSTKTTSSSPPSSTLKRVFSIKTSTSQISVTNNKSLFEQPNRLKYDLADNGLSRPATITVSSISPLLPSQLHSSTISTTTTSNSSGCNSNRSSATSSMLFASSLSSDEDNNTIKFKVVYDCDNIVVIRVPRSTSLDQLRSQVIQKFALLHIDLPKNLSFTCKENARYSSASSIMYSDSLDSGVDCAVTLLSEEEHFINAMQTKWSSLPKVTLRCMV